MPLPRHSRPGASEQNGSRLQGVVLLLHSDRKRELMPSLILVVSRCPRRRALRLTRSSRALDQQNQGEKAFRPDMSTELIVEEDNIDSRLGNVAIDFRKGSREFLNVSGNQLVCILDAITAKSRKGRLSSVDCLMACARSDIL